MVSARSKTNDTTSNYTNRSSKVSFEFSSKLRQSMALNAGQTNKVLLVNPDCYIQILVDYLYEEMGLDVKTKFDFSDENGTLMNIDKLKPHQFATLVLQHKQTYVAVVYEKDENDCYTRLEPLLIKSTKQEADLYLKILKNLIEVKKPSVGSLNQKGSKSASSVSGKKSTKSSSKGNIRKRVNSASQRSKQSVKSD